MICYNYTYACTVAIVCMYFIMTCIHILVLTVRDTLQTSSDGDILTQQYPVWDFVTLVILSELVNVLLMVVKSIMLSCWSTLSVVPVSFNNLYHCTLSLVMLLLNTQVNIVGFPLHPMTSFGSLITVVNINAHM